jgi:hypothetical protein
VWGTIVGAVGATVFVMASRSQLPGPWPWVALLAWAVGVVAYVVFVYALPRTFPGIRMVGPKEGLVYLASVAGMLLLIRLGSLVLDGAAKAELRPALIVVAVGLHFLPFAAAFHTPMFRTLGAIMALLGSVGLLLGWTWDGRAAAVAAVASGVVMLAIIAADAGRATRPPSEDG